MKEPLAWQDGSDHLSGLPGLVKQSQYYQGLHAKIDLF